MTPTNPELRQFIIRFFDDEELETLCFDYFREVQQNFTVGMTKNRKALMLIAYCESRDRLKHLHAALARERPEAWKRTFATPPVETPRQDASTIPAARDSRQIFLSYATADADFAYRLADDLRGEGWQVWIAPESIRPGEKWGDAIERGLDTSGIFIVILTPAAVASHWVNTETDAAVEMQHEGLITFIPLNVVACHLKRLWRQYQYVSFSGSYEVGLDALLGRLEDEPTEHTHPPSNPPPQREGDGPSPLPEDEEVSAPAPQPPQLPHILYRERRIKEEQRRQLSALAHEIAAELGRRSGDNELLEVYQKFNRHFGLDSYRRLPRRQFQEGLAFFTEWRDEVAAVVKREIPAEITRRKHEKTGIELIRIPAGSFLYGSFDSDPIAYDNEKPQQTISLPEYWISRCPVTNAQFARFVQATNYKTTAEREGTSITMRGDKWESIRGVDWQHPYGPESSLNGKDDYPVVLVSWKDAKTFCDWAGLMLPTEEQWEKAARGKRGRIWPWGDDPPTTKHCNFNRNVSGTTPVGNYSPDGDSPYGCADMAGNVSEWTASWYTEGRTRALRGGSWFVNVQVTRAALRDSVTPHYWSLLIGFRVVELLSEFTG